MNIKVEEETETNIFTFKDAPWPSDVYHDYPDNLHADSVPIIIDNGSFQCRTGWLTDPEPRIIFKSLVGKQRSKKNPDSVDILLGNEIGASEVARWQLKSQFDKNVVTQYDTQEQIFDYMFSRLGINTTGSVDHPILLTEAVCNPNYCRQKLSELLFEGYHVPGVAYGVDALFSLYNNHPSPESADALVISCGYNTTHILPVLSGQLQSRHCRRINVGGSHLESFLQKILQLKYPGHLAHITPCRAEEILRAHCYFAKSYGDEIDRWFSEDYYVDHVLKYQLPFTAVTTSASQLEVQKKKREQQVKWLKDLNAKKREEKLAAEQEKLNELVTLYELYEDEDDETFQRALQQYGIVSVEELQDTIKKLGASIQQLRYKILMGGDPQSRASLGNDLVGIPDEMLTSEQQEVKRRQKLMKSLEGEATAPKRSKIDRKPDFSDMVPDDPEAMEDWIKKLRKDRQRLLDHRAERKQRKSDMTKRRTQASQQRMKIITELARGSRKKKEDTFGQNDDDWNVYKAINKDAGDSDSEAEQEKLEEMETQLREYDPQFKDPNAPSGELDVKEYYRLHIGVEQIRVPELLFQPSMIGLDQAGIAETIDFVLSKFSPAEQQRLVQHVFLTGGCASFPHFLTRLDTELQTSRPFQSTFQTSRANDPMLDAWLGAQKWARSGVLENHLLTRAEYEEKGADYLHEHYASNVYIKTPAPKSPVKGCGSPTAARSPIKVPLTPPLVKTPTKGGVPAFSGRSPGKGLATSPLVKSSPGKLLPGNNREEVEDT